MRVLLLSATLTMVGGGCSTVGDDVYSETLYVDATTQECVGEAVQQCFRVRRSPEAEWELFYSEIDEFDQEPGFRYVLEVEVTEIPDPPADGSSLSYRLIRISSRAAA
ncbi:DUF4377 domain-containing protein [Rubrivirga sp.]|uniref:DUF4377 domain-containing protein n=1 Tax=Rubrivirga sp. TaxID=1885344 RepID=UPI003C7900E6